MIYVKWAALVPLSFLMEIVGKIGSPVLALFVDENGWLPSWLSWFQTPDNSCDGDAGHLERWPRGGTFWTWLRRTAWLFRNTAYGFNVAIGFKSQDGDLRAISGNDKIGDTSGISGFCTWRVFRDGKQVCFQHYFVQHYRIFGVWKCVRAGIGYKIWGDPAGSVYGQHWIYFHPIKGSGRQE